MTLPLQGRGWRFDSAPTHPMNSGAVLAGVSTIFMSLSAVVASAVTKTIHPLVLIVLAYGVSMLFFLPFLLKGNLQIRKLFREFPRDILKVVIFRSIIGQMLIIYGFSMTLAIRAVFMARLEPVFVFLFSVLLIGEAVRKRKIGLIILLILGAFLISTGGSIFAFNNLMLGDLFIVASLIFLAYTYIPSSRIMKRINTQTLTAVSNFFGMLIIAPIAFFLLPAASFHIGLESWALVIVYALSFYFIGLLLWFKAFEKAKPWVVASMLALTPIWGSLISFFWLGQTLSPVQILGGVIIIIATIIIAKKR